MHRIRSSDILTRTAIGCGIVALAGAGYFSWRIQDNFRQQGFYKKTLELFHGYEPAVNHLGVPIRIKRLDLGKTEINWTNGLNARLAIPLVGQKQNATLHSWSSRSTVNDEWTIDRLDIELKNKKWTFYLNPQLTASTDKPVQPNKSENTLTTADNNT